MPAGSKTYITIHQTIRLSAIFIRFVTVRDQCQNRFAKDNELPTLETARWKKQWQRVQYKSTPCRIESVWIRLETGDCRLSDEKGRNLCFSTPVPALRVLSGEIPRHSATDRLKQDHPSLELTSLKPVLKVIDYRYRVELLDAEERVVYENLS